MTKLVEAGSEKTFKKLRSYMCKTFKVNNFNNFCRKTCRGQDTVVVIAAGRQRSQSSSLGRVNNFLFSILSRPGLGHTQPPIQLVPGALSLGGKW
jgi:hypothetical protein